MDLSLNHVFYFLSTLKTKNALNKLFLNNYSLTYFLIYLIVNDNSGILTSTPL